MSDTIIHAKPLMVASEHAAAALGISERTLQNLVAAGDLPPPRKISKQRVGWLWRELEAFAETRPVSDLQPAPGRRSAAADPTAA